VISSFFIISNGKITQCGYIRLNNFSKRNKNGGEVAIKTQTALEKLKRKPELISNPRS
jgi:hypothetical protein